MTVELVESNLYCICFRITLNVYQFRHSPSLPSFRAVTNFVFQCFGVGTFCGQGRVRTCKRSLAMIPISLSCNDLVSFRQVCDYCPLQSQRLPIPPPDYQIKQVYSLLSIHPSRFSLWHRSSRLGGLWSQMNFISIQSAFPFHSRTNHITSHSI